MDNFDFHLCPTQRPFVYSPARAHLSNFHGWNEVDSGATAGVIDHVSLFNRGEWHMRVPHILTSHVLLIILSALLALR